MREYHKIQSVFKRDMETKHKTLIIGNFSTPEFEYLQNNIWEFDEKVDGTNLKRRKTYPGATGLDNCQPPIPGSTVVGKTKRTFPK
jgi:hypothetical protein